MTQDYPKPIAPPPELVQQWREELVHDPTKPFAQAMADRAAEWGADQELEACCEYMERWVPAIDGTDPSKCLRAARRPKPPSLKERALEAMHRNWNPHNNDDFATIARALEQLDD